MSEKRAFINRFDFLLIGTLLTLSCAIFFLYSFHRDSHAAFCEIYVGENLVDVLDLSENRIVILENNPNIRLEIKDNAVAFIESDCPDKLCVKSGFLKYTWQTAACLPNRTAIKIISDKADYGKTDVDADTN